MRPSRLRMPDLIHQVTRVAAVSMGIALGVMPKANLSALVIIAWLTLANHMVRSVVIVTGISFLVSSFTFPYIQQIGSVAFQFGPTRYVLGFLETMPVVPWFRLNNPAVFGGLVVGELAFFGLLFGRMALSLRQRSKATENQKTTPFPLLLGLERESNKKQFGEEIATPRPIDREKTEPLFEQPETPATEPAKHLTVHAPSFSPSLSPSFTPSFSSIDEIELYESAIASALEEDYSNMEIHESTIEIIRFRSREDMLQTKDARIPKIVDPFSLSIPPLTTPLIKPNNMANTESSSLLFASSNLNSDFPQSIARLEGENHSPEPGSASVIIPIHNETKVPIDFQNPISSNANVSDKSSSSTLHLDDVSETNINKSQMDVAFNEDSAAQPRDEALKYLLWHLSGEKSSTKLRERAS